MGNNGMNKYQLGTNHMYIITNLGINDLHPLPDFLLFSELLCLRLFLSPLSEVLDLRLLLSPLSLCSVVVTAIVCTDDVSAPTNRFMFRSIHIIACWIPHRMSAFPFQTHDVMSSTKSSGVSSLNLRRSPVITCKNEISPINF